MQSVTNKRPAERLNAHELLRDYVHKINAACPLALVHHDQGADGATLVVHVPQGNVAEAEALVKLAERLTKLVASFPAPKIEQPAEGQTSAETVDEKQKAVVEAPINRRRSRKQEATNEQQDSSAAAT